jgi:AraC-like DNA-binding protein
MAIPKDVYKKIVSAKIFLDNNFRETIDLDRLSLEACLSRFHFHRLFTRIYRRTPHQYLTRKRIEEAQDGLAGDDLSVSDICYSLGFESLGSFSMLFKKETGLPPIHFRRQAWQKKQQTIEQPKSFIPHCYIQTLMQSSTSPGPDANSNFQETEAI